MRKMEKREDKDENQNKGEIIDICPSEIIYNGKIQGSDNSIVNYRLITPGGHPAGVLLLFYNEHSLCPRCATPINNRPILLMDTDQFTYPCLFCKAWVWWPINERRIESRFQ